MKKITVLITSLILTLLLVACFSNNDIANKSERELRKGLTEAKIYRCVYIDGNLANKELSAIQTFDKDGNIATITSYDDEGMGAGYKIVYTYNQAHMVIGTIEYDADGNNLGSESMKYYPGDTVMSEKISERLDEDGNIEIFEYKYDDKGNETYCASYKKDVLEWEWITENVYNEKNQLIKTIRTMKSATYKGTQEVTDLLDENGNVFDQNYSNTEKQFNSNGQVIEEKLSDSGERITYKYNKRGLIEEQIMYDGDGNPIAGTITEYK